jgi:hypothetical protein
MIRILFSLIAISFCLKGGAQTDYSKLQDNITAVCGVQSYESVESDKEFLDSLSAEEIEIGLEAFLLDKAWVY